jgi:predicted ribosomally synthesized peptide with SipW-like signal peptide
MSGARKALWSALIVAVLGGLAAVGAFAAFSDTTSNANNQFSTGTMTIGDNATSPLYSVSNGKPGTPSPDHCIKITYGGSLPASVKLYRTAFSGGSTPNLSTFVTLTVTKGTGTQENCSDFSGSTQVYNSLLSSFATDWTSGLALTNASGNAAWGQGDAVTYKFSAEVADDNNATGLSTGTHSFTWEARNN